MKAILKKFRIDFILENERILFNDKNGEILPYEPLELTVPGLQFKYNELIGKWMIKINDAKGGSRL